MKILALNPQTDMLLGELNNRGDKIFSEDKHIKEIDGENSFQFITPIGIKEAKFFDQRSRILIPSETGSFEEFIVFHTNESMDDKKEVVSTAAYTEMDKEYVISPGTYVGTLPELANEALAFTTYDLGVYESIQKKTIVVTEHVGVYTYLSRLAKEFELEMPVRVETSGTRFTGRFVDFVKRIGPDLKKEVIYGRDLTGIDKTVYSDRIVTELLCIGPEREDGSRLNTVVRDEDAFQRWNRNGKPIIGIYIPESSEQDMTLKQLEQYGRTELNKRIASVVEYVITAASMEKAFPNQKVVLGCSLRIKNPEFDPPLYAEARVIRVERSIYDETQKIYHIGEVKTYSEEDIYKTFRQLQAQYNLRVIRSIDRPAGSANRIWIQITPDSSLEIPHVWSAELNDWVKIAPSTAAEIGAETPEGAQDKADEALRLAREDISGVQDALDSLEVGINTTFADGIIEEAEARAIETYLNTIGTEKVSVDNRYTAIYSDVLLIGTVKSTLSEAKTLFNIAHADLTGSIRMAISDGRTTATEKADVEVKFTAYRTRLAILATAFETAGSAIASAKAAVATEDAKDYTDDQLSSFVPFIEYTNKLAELQSQIDGSVMTWFEFGQPTAQNYPALEWTTEEMRNIHLGDVYYDKDTGFAYRYTIEQGVHTWTDLKDSDVTKALKDAAEAKDTADGKRRVFIAPPIPPYDPGDLWTQGAGGDILRCVKQKIIGQVYAASDWQKAAKYTDDTRAVQAEENAKDHADQRSTEIAAEINQTIQQTRINLETELAAKAGLNYVDGQFNLVDSELNSMLGNINLITGDVSGITSRIDGLQATSSDLQSRVALNEDALLAGNGRMTTFETDVNELAGTMSTTITQLSNIEGTITNQQAQIEANATAITLKASQASLDTLTGEVSDIGAELSVQAGKITLKAESSALATVDNKVTGVRNDLATLEVGVSGISSSVTSLRTEFDGLEIGGRNFILNSSDAFRNSSVGTYTGRLSLEGDIIYLADYDIKVGDKITFRVYLDCTQNTLKGGRARISYYRPDNTYSAVTGVIINIGQEGYSTVSWVVAEGFNRVQVLIQNSNTAVTTAEAVPYKKAKLEKGNKATEWTPAPEDVDLSINSVQQFASTVDQKADSIISNVNSLTQTVNGHTTSISNAQSSITQLSNSVALKAEQTQVETMGGQIVAVDNRVANLTVDVNGISTGVTALSQKVDGHTTSISNAQSSINQLSNSVALKAEQTQVNTIAGQVSTMQSDVSSLTVGVDGITTNVSSLRSDLNGLEVGGRNLLVDSENINFISNNNAVYPITDQVFESHRRVRRAFNQTSTDVRLSTYTARFYPVVEGRNYIESIEVKPEFEVRLALSSTGAYKLCPAGVWTKLIAMLTHTGAATTKRFMGIYGSGFSLEFNPWIEYRNLKSEEGNKATDWTPAPEDTDAAIAAVGSRVTSAESSITQLSNSIALKASQSSMDGLTGRMNSAESALTVQAGQISSKVSTTDFNGNKLVSLINQSATTVDIEASRINLIGAVTVLSDITGQLGNITAGTIDGVTFKSGTGTSRSFTLAGGMAEFIEKSGQSGVEVLTRTTLNDNALSITNSISGEVYYSSQLRADVLLLNSQGLNAEYGHDRLLLHRGLTSEIALYANAFASSVVSANALQLSGKGQTLSIENETLRYNGSPIGFSGREVLWTGAFFMRANQTITPPRKLSDCPTGWLLAWSRYVNGAPANSDWNYKLIPKSHAEEGGGIWMDITAADVNADVPPTARKYVYVTDTTIIGHDRNGTGTETGQVLRKIIAF